MVQRCNPLIRLLTIVSFPSAFRQLHICEYRFERGFFRRARIDAKPYLAATMKHVTYSHLTEMLTILRAFDAIVFFSTRETVPHSLDFGVNGSRCPIGIAVVSYDTPQMLIRFVLVLNATFQPILAVKVHYYAALVKTVPAFREVRLDNKAEKPLLCFHLEYRGVIIPEMVVCALPKVCFGFGNHLYGFIADYAPFRPACPFEIVCIECHNLIL